MHSRIVWTICLVMMIGSNGCSRQRDKTALSGNIRLQLGLEYLALSDYSAALRNLNLAQQAQPGNFRSALALAKLWQAQGAIDQASIWYAKALSIAPKNGYLLNNYGAFLCSLMQYDKAQRQFRLAQQANELGARNSAQTQSAFCFILSQHWSRAKSLLMDRGPSFQPVGDEWLAQAHQWVVQQHYSSARYLLENYHQRFSATAESLWQMIKVAAQQGDTAVIKRYGTQLAQLFPYSIQYQRYIANEY